MLDAYRALFERTGFASLNAVAVYKTRAVRKIRLDTISGDAEEVDAKSLIDRGLTIQLTDVTVDETSQCLRRSTVR